MAWRPGGLRRRECVRSGVGTRVQRPWALGGVVRRERKVGWLCWRLLDASFRFGDVGAQGVERVIGDEAAPDERPEGVDGLAGIAVADGFVEMGEKCGAAAGRGRRGCASSRG